MIEIVGNLRQKKATELCVPTKERSEMAVLSLILLSQLGSFKVGESVESYSGRWTLPIGRIYKVVLSR